MSKELCTVQVDAIILQHYCGEFTLDWVRTVANVGLGKIRFGWVRQGWKGMARLGKGFLVSNSIWWKKAKIAFQNTAWKRSTLVIYWWSISIEEKVRTFYAIGLQIKAFSHNGRVGRKRVMFSQKSQEQRQVGPTWCWLHRSSRFNGDSPWIAKTRDAKGAEVWELLMIKTWVSWTGPKRRGILWKNRTKHVCFSKEVIVFGAPFVVWLSWKALQSHFRGGLTHIVSASHANLHSNSPCRNRRSRFQLGPLPER